ncbi:MAG TPA: hypothetical protein VK779_00890 [Rhizomicrobium sp.]|nr:hypothetical protein [Rhizomicrobium sp.]
MDKEIPIACSLTGEAFEARLDWLKALQKRALIDHWREGASLHLVFDKTAGRDVEELIEKENACCGFLSFMSAEDERGVHVTIAPPNGAEGFIDELLSHFVPT